MYTRVDFIVSAPVEVLVQIEKIAYFTLDNINIFTRNTFTSFNTTGNLSI